MKTYGMKQNIFILVLLLLLNNCFKKQNCWSFPGGTVFLSVLVAAPSTWRASVGGVGISPKLTE